jgi:hypothetical protein
MQTIYKFAAWVATYTWTFGDKINEKPKCKTISSLKEDKVGARKVLVEL